MSYQYYHVFPHRPPWPSAQMTLVYCSLYVVPILPCVPPPTSMTFSSDDLGLLFSICSTNSTMCSPTDLHDLQLRWPWSTVLYMSYQYYHVFPHRPPWPSAQMTLVYCSLYVVPIVPCVLYVVPIVPPTSMTFSSDDLGLLFSICSTNSTMCSSYESKSSTNFISHWGPFHKPDSNVWCPDKCSHNKCSQH